MTSRVTINLGLGRKRNGGGASTRCARDAACDRQAGRAAPAARLHFRSTAITTPTSCATAVARSAGCHGANTATASAFRAFSKLLKKSSIPATFFVPAVTALLYPDEQRRVIAEGHEIGLHGWIHELNSILPEKDERELHLRSAETLTGITGIRPVGMRTPSWDFSPATLTIQREMGLLYDSSLMADDDPYELNQDGEPTGIVELPVEWIRDDAVYFNMNRFQALRPYTPPTAVLDIFRREFDQAYEDGGLFLLTMHPHVIGYRSRMFILEELIRHMQARPGVWFATHRDVALQAKAQL